MKTATLLKFLTFILFIILIGIFVSYRSGAFSKDENIAPLPLSSIDTSGRGKAVKDSISRDSIEQRLYMMSGSKSLIITEPRSEPILRRETIMESSKLGKVFPPKYSIKPKNDSILFLKKDKQ